MAGKVWLAITLIGLLGVSHIYTYRTGWYAHSDKVNREYREAKDKAEEKQDKSKKASNTQKVEVEIKYKTINRDVIRYVQNPNRTICSFDDDWLQIRNAAISADKSISRDVK